MAEAPAGIREPFNLRRQEGSFAGRWLDGDGINEIGTCGITGKIQQQFDDPVLGVHHAFRLQRSRTWNQHRQRKRPLNAAQCR